MILIDFSSIIHRMIHTSVAVVKPEKIDGKYRTADFINMIRYLILQDLFNIHQLHNHKFGDIIICLDKSDNGYWRKDVHPGYKASRKKGREESEINFGEIFVEVDELITQIKENLPWKVVEVKRAEADDLMLVLAREFNQYEKILIHSPDKDMIQAQRNTNNVFQYSALTKKWIVPENKHDHMDHWIMEHVVLGDASDEVPKVVDGTEFSDNFLCFLNENNCSIHCVKTFKESNFDKSFISKYNVYKTNKKGEPTELDVYKDIRFGGSNIQKILDGTWDLNKRKDKLKEQKEKLKAEGKSTKELKEITDEIKNLEKQDKQPHEFFNDWLDSHPLYRSHYERNFTLVMEEGIPSNIWNEIIIAFKEADSTYNSTAFKEYLIKNNLGTILMEVDNIFYKPETITVENCGW